MSSPFRLIVGDLGRAGFTVPLLEGKADNDTDNGNGDSNGNLVIVELKATVAMTMVEW